MAPKKKSTGLSGLIGKRISILSDEGRELLPGEHLQLESVEPGWLGVNFINLSRVTFLAEHTIGMVTEYKEPEECTQQPT